MLFSVRFLGVGGTDGGMTIFAGSATGQTSITPHRTGYFDAVLQARDASGASVEVLSWRNMTAIPRPEFQRKLSADSERCVGDARARAEAMTYTLNETTVVPGFDCSRADLFENFKDNNPVGIAFTLRFKDGAGLEVDPPGTSTYAQAATGRLLIESQTLGAFTAAVMASDGRGAAVAVYAWSFSVVAKPDLGLGAAASSNDDAVGPTAYGAIFAVVALAVLVLVGSWQYNKVLAQRRLLAPEDWSATLNRMVEDGELVVDTAAAIKVPIEIPRKQIEMVQHLGSGQFGDVWKAMLEEDGRDGYLVAAKTVRDAAASPQARQDLVYEAGVMAQVSEHRNIVSLLGVCTAGSPLLLVCSYCEHGSLEDIYRQPPEARTRFGLAEQLAAAVEIASGMDHLAQLHFVHRDLAARNVLLATNYVCKVAGECTPPACVAFAEP